MCQMWLSLPEKINTGCRTWHAAIALANAFFLIPMRMVDQKQVAFLRVRQQHTFMILSQIVNSPALCHIVVPKQPRSTRHSAEHHTDLLC